MWRDSLTRKNRIEAFFAENGILTNFVPSPDRNLEIAENSNF